MAGLPAVLDTLDLAVARARAILDETELAEPAAAAAAARDRRGFLGGTLVMAVAGGTGSGKSSVINALVGEEVAPVSPIRPHTEEALAVCPAAAEPGLETLLDRYGIDRRAVQDRFPDVALVDLPDHDSVVPGHRATVEALLPHVDGVIWVADPEKYRDRPLHDRYLSDLADYGDQFVFVLNQVDRVGSDAGEVVADFAASLRASGIREPVVFGMAADPPEGQPDGVADLASYLGQRLDAKRVAVGKLLADMKRAGELLATSAGLGGGGSLDFEERWGQLLGQLEVASPGDHAAVHDASCRIEDFVAALAVEAGGEFGRRLRVEFPPARLETEVGKAFEEAAASSPPEAPERRTWFPWRGRKRAGIRSAAEAAAAQHLDERLGGPMRELLWGRGELAATLAAFRVELAAEEARLFG